MGRVGSSEVARHVLAGHMGLVGILPHANIFMNASAPVPFSPRAVVRILWRPTAYAVHPEISQCTLGR